MKMKDFSIVALTLVGAIITSCSKDNKIIDIQQPQQDNVVTLTSNININSGTRALNDDGTNCTKTFAAGDQVAVVYKNTSNETVKALSNALTAGDISNAGKTATITVTLTNPADNGNLQLIYPAAMAKATIATDATVDDAGTVNFDALATQNGTLASLASNLDLCTFTGALNGTDLPNTASLTNKLAICKFTINDNASNDITSSVTKLVITDGAGIYTITPSSLSTIYVAIPPVASEKTITLTATKGSDYFTKSVTGKALAASNLYPITVGMNKAYPFSISSTEKVLIAPGNLQYQASTNTWRFAEHQYDYVGNAVGNTTTGDDRATQSDWIDLFSWGTSGYDDPGSDHDTYFHPWDNRESSYYGPGAVSGFNYSGDNLTGELTKYDWGVYNAIGSDPAGVWRTLTGTEWRWLITPKYDAGEANPGTNCRTSSTVNGVDNARYAKATIDGNNGVIIFPDSYTHPGGVTPPASASINNISSTYSSNIYTTSDWSEMESAGAVFLPAAGYRYWYSGSEYRIGGVNGTGAYWSRTCGSNNGNAQNGLWITDENLNTYQDNARWRSFSVRLVRDL